MHPHFDSTVTLTGGKHERTGRSPIPGDDGEVGFSLVSMEQCSRVSIPDIDGTTFVVIATSAFSCRHFARMKHLLSYRARVDRLDLRKRLDW